jgi:hypothetical protein
MAMQVEPGRVKRDDWTGFEITVPMQEAAWENRNSNSALWLAAKESGYLKECLRLRRARNAESPDGTNPGAA